MTQIKKFQTPAGALTYIPQDNTNYLTKQYIEPIKLTAEEINRINKGISIPVESEAVVVETPTTLMDNTLLGKAHNKLLSYSDKNRLHPFKGSYSRLIESVKNLRQTLQGGMGWVPGLGDFEEVLQIGEDINNKNYGQAALGAGLFLLPGNFGKLKNKLQFSKFKKQLQLPDYFDELTPGECYEMFFSPEELLSEFPEHPEFKKLVAKKQNRIKQIRNRYESLVDDYTDEELLRGLYSKRVENRGDYLNITYEPIANDVEYLDNVKLRKEEELLRSKRYQEFVDRHGVYPFKSGGTIEAVKQMKATKNLNGGKINYIDLF